MKLLHTSDWHLGMTFRGGVSYEADQKYAIEQICKIAVEEQVDGILLAGDVFDKSIASKDALRVYDETMTYICSTLDIPIYMIAGNHDGAERISQCNELLKKSGLYIAGALEAEPQVVHLDGVDIYLLPWISTDKVKAIYPEHADEVTSMESAYQVVLDRYRDSFVEGHKNILVSHAYVASAETSVSDRAAEIGHATIVDAKVFDGFDYVALGHIHGPQQITDHIRYSGTPMAYAFGKEEKQTKSVTIIDTDTMEQKIVALSQLHKRTTLTDTFEVLMQADYDKDILDGYVRLEVTDKYVGMESYAAFKEKYTNLLEVISPNFEGGEGKIAMTIDEFESAKDDPEVIFKRFCEEILEVAPDRHMLNLFQHALETYEKEVSES